MRDLQELARIVTKSKLRTVELLSHQKGDTKLWQFYEMLQEGQLESDQEAAQHFYDSDPQNRSYQKLRNSLKDRLINSLFLIDLKRASYNTRQKAYYESYRDWAAAKILFGKQAFSVALSITRKILKLARLYEFTELVVDITHTLRLHYGSLDGDLKKYQQYNQLFKEYEQIWSLENKAEELYLNLSISYIKAKGSKSNIIEEAKKAYHEISPYLEQVDAYQFKLCAYLIEIAQYSSQNDYPAMYEVCNRSITFFQAKKYLAKIPLQVFCYQKLVCLHQLGKFDQCQEGIGPCIALMQKESTNWFKMQQLQFLSHLHLQQFDQATKLYHQVSKKRSLKEKPPTTQESWWLNELYLHFLNLAAVTKIKLPKLRMARALNQFEIFSKDKNGMNIAVLIIDILIHIITPEKNDELIDRIEAIDKYRKRYLQTNELIRANLFLKLLLLFPKNSFNIEIIKKKAQQDYSMLTSHALPSTNQPFAIEILSFEYAWDLLVTQTNMN